MRPQQMSASRPLRSRPPHRHARPKADTRLIVKRRVAASPDQPFAAGALSETDELRDYGDCVEKLRARKILLKKQNMVPGKRAPEKMVSG